MNRRNFLTTAGWTAAGLPLLATTGCGPSKPATPPMPSLLNIIFHGAWGFKVESKDGIITAMTPKSCLNYLMGDVWGSEKTFGDGSLILSGATGGDARPAENRNSYVHLAQLRSAGTCFRNAVAPYCQIVLPYTDAMFGIRCIARDPNQELLTGCSLGYLAGKYLAMGQVLQYKIDPSEPTVLKSGGAPIWKPDAAYNAGRQSVNLQVYAQPAANAGPSGDHFQELTQVFSMALHFAPTITSIKAPTEPQPEPKGVGQHDELDLMEREMPAGSSPVADCKPPEGTPFTIASGCIVAYSD